MIPLDAKVYGVLFKTKDDRVIPPDEFIVFRPYDNACLPTLEFYYEECKRIGAHDAQLKAIQGLIQRVKDWRNNNQHRCKVPDVDVGEM